MQVLHRYSCHQYLFLQLPVLISKHFWGLKCQALFPKNRSIHNHRKSLMFYKNKVRYHKALLMLQYGYKQQDSENMQAVYQDASWENFLQRFLQQFQNKKIEDFLLVKLSIHLMVTHFAVYQGHDISSSFQMKLPDEIFHHKFYDILLNYLWEFHVFQQS